MSSFLNGLREGFSNAQNGIDNVGKITAGRKSNLILMIALAGNAFLTFMFAYNYLPSLFDMFGAEQDGNSLLVARFMAGFFAVVVFDGAFYAWGQYEHRDGNSEKQIATAGNAKRMSLYGSLAASAGQFVLAQAAADIPVSIVFTVSVGSTVAVGTIAVLHMQWWAKYNDESFSSQEMSSTAAVTAQVKGAAQKEVDDLANLELTRARHAHDMKMKQLMAEMELEQLKIQAENDIKRELIQQEVDHETAVAKQTRELLGKQVLDDASRVAQAKSEILVRKFQARHGTTVSNVPASEVVAPSGNPPPMPANAPAGASWSWAKIGGVHQWALIFPPKPADTAVPSTLAPLPNGNGSSR